VRKDSALREVLLYTQCRASSIGSPCSHPSPLGYLMLLLLYRGRASLHLVMAHGTNRHHGGSSVLQVRLALDHTRTVLRGTSLQLRWMVHSVFTDLLILERDREINSKCECNTILLQSRRPLGVAGSLRRFSVPWADIGYPHNLHYPLPALHKGAYREAYVVD